MNNKKIFILLPDGIGLRNFAYTDFYEIGIERGFDITFWNNTPFELTESGFKEIKIQKARVHPLTDFLKKAQVKIELSQNSAESKDPVYDTYRFQLTNRNLKSILKNFYVNWLFFWNNSQKGLLRIRKRIAIQERKTKLYFDSLDTLQKEKPDLVFCTNQRITLAVAPILAAQDLGIQTATFIFSWDNLPKGTKVLETDFYFVWSQHMKEELSYYYPYVKENQISVTGTTQFEPHYNESIIQLREVFFEIHGLDKDKKYICFSGDDVTTSPNDPTYLADVAQAIRLLNNKGYHLGIIFRRCPVDFSDRFDTVLEKNSDIIKPIVPKWEKIGEGWNTILPTEEDLILQMNTIFHTEMVINLGSSMVFDYVAHKKPCGFINYDVPNKAFPDWSVKKIYNFIHFRSMPSKDAVFWINNPHQISETIEKMLSNDDSEKVVRNAQKWFEKINLHPAELASERIWNAIEKIIKA
jgi:hypothetical protein